ncbi:MAG TPA: RtcB family protein, partial [Bdellovibrionales bacterium]|nr:RtcB family protein [Bdellovibrionales bacterium]
PIKIWSELEKVEGAAINQLVNTANLPFVFKHVAAMPDVHLGKGATVGSVIATKGAICPAAVGVDIGCGMMAVKTPLDHRRVLDNLPAIRHSIERSIPLGHESNRRITGTVSGWKGWSAWDGLSFTDKKLREKAMSQLGSLGGGNHFIELCLDTVNNVWVMLHSGSRNVGKTLAERHINEAKYMMEMMKVHLADHDLAYFTEESRQFKAYLHDLLWAQQYAFQNRIEMMGRVMKDLAHAVNDKNEIPRLLEVNCHHNYVAVEEHFGESVYVTRKGAVRAREGDLGIIPGSMGAKSFIVRGKGNEDAFHSCSHGAGRLMSRGEAKRRFTVDDLRRETTGVECRKDAGVIDEIPSAYKNIDEVMANQTDLVDVVAQLKQVLCIKG